MRVIGMVAIVALMAGCASTGVVPIGEDTYMLAKTSAACGFRSASGTKAKLYEEAGAFCRKQGKTVRTVEVTGKDGVPFARCASAELQFKCVSGE